MTDGVSSAQEKPESAILKRIAMCGAFLSLAVGVILTIARMNLQDPGSQANLLTLAAVVALAAAILVLAIWTIQKKLPEKFRAPTGIEIGNDLFVSLWGILFVVPLLLVGLDGLSLSGQDRLLSASLAFLGITFPAIRPRYRTPRGAGKNDEQSAPQPSSTAAADAGEVPHH